MPAPAIISGVSTVGNLVGGGKAAGEQNNATNQAAAQQAQVMQMVNNYIGTVSPVVSQFVGGLLNGTNPAASAIMANLGALAGFGNSASNQAVGNFGASAPNQALEDYNGLKPEELSALTDNAARSGMSDIETAKSQGAFGANQNAVIGNQLEKNRQSSENAAVNVGSSAAAAELQAKEAAASNALGGLETANQAGLSGLGAAASGGNSLLGNTNQGVVAGESLLNPGTSGAGLISGLSAQNNENANTGNPYGPAANSAAQTAAMFTNGKGGSSPVGTRTGNTAYNAPGSTINNLTTEMPSGSGSPFP